MPSGSPPHSVARGGAFLAGQNFSTGVRWRLARDAGQTLRRVAAAH